MTYWKHGFCLDHVKLIQEVLCHLQGLI